MLQPSSFTTAFRQTRSSTCNRPFTSGGNVLLNEHVGEEEEEQRGSSRSSTCDCVIGKGKEDGETSEE